MESTLGEMKSDLLDVKVQLQNITDILLSLCQDHHHTVQIGYDHGEWVECDVSYIDFISFDFKFHSFN